MFSPWAPLSAGSTCVTPSQAFDPGWFWSEAQCHHHKCGSHSPLKFTDLLCTPTEMQSENDPHTRHPSEICVQFVFITRKKGLVERRVGGGGGEINLMSGFNCWVTNQWQLTLLDVLLGFPKIRNILFFQKAVAKEIITPIQSVLILRVVCFFFFFL